MVLGVTAIVGAIGIDKSFYKLTWPVMILFSVVLYYFLWNDSQLIPIEGAILFIALIIFVVYLIKSQNSTEELEDVDDALSAVSSFKILVWLLIGALALFFGSEWLVKGATQIATQLGVSEAVIGVTMIAIGTSVPELAASVIAAAKQEKAISLGNLIGSNIFNIGSVLGLTSIVKTIPIEEPLILSRDIFWMLLFAAVILPLGLIPKKNTIDKFKGFALVVVYAVFIFIVFKG